MIAVLAIGTWWPGQTSSPKLGLDLRGGTQVTLTPRATSGAVITDTQLQQAVEIIRQRVNGLGVAEAEVSTQGSGNNSAIIVSIPGVTEQGIANVLRQTALLSFRAVETVEANAPNEAAQPLVAPLEFDANDSSLQAGFAALDCSKPEARQGGKIENTEKWLVTCSIDGTLKYVVQPAFIKGESIDDARAEIPQNSFDWVVTLDFDSQGANQLAQASNELYVKPSPQNQFAIVLDGLVVSSPYFSEPIPGGSAQITGGFTVEEAKELANVLKYGALPLTLDLAEITSISPTLGEDQLSAGLLAGFIGLALVTVYLLFYYRVLGLSAIFSLVLAGLFTYVAVVVLGKVLGFTLTLAGIAGIIVAIGITADSFIVYFERIRDEIREGKALRPAVDAAWKRARRTILIADAVQLLAAVVLYFLSVGTVRGFAFTLGLTTVIDALVAFLFTRPVVTLFARNPWFSKGSKLTGLDAARLGVSNIATAHARSSFSEKVGNER